ncbi:MULTISPECIES: hypothetical protein [Bacillales]|uniref:PH domain-containing protein n=1 Tax=Lysinibacillus louembei TaxID=1470088 RepID=A0ABZ0RZH2_9BACI|nr:MULTISPECIES: hypothetical protein [Bacillales]MCT6925753.1 hypothetical protein [Metasolibacillus sp.]MCT6941957.1 hypothetical protein [Metasolibacillus sp.]WPK12865.1 hypothetical protein R6U77_03935 [Lysinibacillus louembei]
MLDREKKTIYAVFAIAIAIIAPIIVLFTPYIIAVTFYDYADKIVFVPLPSSLIVYTFAFVAAVASLIGMYFLKKRIFKIGLGVFAIIAFFFLFIGGTRHYVYIDTSGIESAHWLKGKKHYEWGDIVQLDYTKKTINRVHDDEMRFTFHDQSTITLPVGGLVDEPIANKIVKYVRKSGAPVNEIIITE